MGHRDVRAHRGRHRDRERRSADAPDDAGDMPSDGAARAERPPCAAAGFRDARHRRDAADRARIHGNLTGAIDLDLTRREAMAALTGGLLAGLTSELTVPSASAQTATTDAASSSASFPVTIEVDVAKTIGPLHPIWRFFGADEPNYAYMKDGKKLLAELGKIGPGNTFFRTHNLLTTGDGTPALKWGSTNAYTEDANGKPIYDWTIVDRIFDTYLKRNVKPYVQIGFMPRALSSKPE